MRKSCIARGVETRTTTSARMAEVLAAIAVAGGIAACGGGHGGGGFFPPPNPGQAKLSCDETMKTRFAPALTQVLLVKSFKTGDPLLLSGSPGTDTPVASSDVCVVKLLVGPCNPGPADAPSTSQGIGIEVWLPSEGKWNQRIHVKGGGWAGGVQTSLTALAGTAVLPHAKAGRVRLLGVSSAQRLPSQPDIPTIAEQGLPGFEALSWAALMVPAGTPAPIVQQLNAAANRALRSKLVLDHYAKSESQPRGGAPEEFAAFLRTEVRKWGEAVVASGAQVD